MSYLLFLAILPFLLENSVFVQAQAGKKANVTICKKKEDLICPKRPITHCQHPIFRFQCPRTCGLCVDKPVIPQHLVTVDKARSAMNDVIQDLIGNIHTPNSTKNSTQKNRNINQVNEVMYQIERSIGQADLSRKKYKLPELKKDIKEAVELGNVKFARRALGIALNTIGKSSSGTVGRRKRSTRSDAKKFLTNLKKELGEKKFSKIFALEGRKSLMFAIDITGSMDSVIDKAKAIAIEISKYKRTKLPRDYILSSFGDPSDMGDTVHKEKDQVNAFINEINNLKANGGGDCKEYAYRGMFAAIEEGPEHGSPLFVFTDAPPKDGTDDNVDMLLYLAEENGVTINFFIEEGCGTTFETYKKLTSETGGGYFKIKTAELKRVAKFTDSSLDSVATVKSGGSVAKKRKRRSTMDEISIPVDNTIAQLVIPVTTEGSATGISLLAPSGITWTEGMNALSNVAIYIIESPSEGNWKLQVPASAGEYQYAVKVSSSENIDFKYRYTKEANRKILEFKYPLAGESAKVDLTISGVKQIQKDSLRVDIVDISGKVLISNTKPTRNDKDGVRYTLRFHPPNEKFKIMIKGRTIEDKVFHRVSPHVNQVKPLALKQFYNSGSYKIKPGGSVFIMLYLFNGMDTNQVFTISFRDTLGYKVSLLGRSKLAVRGKSKKFLRVSVRYSGGKLGKIGQTENVIILVKGSRGTSALEVVSLMVK